MPRARVREAGVSAHRSTRLLQDRNFGRHAAGAGGTQINRNAIRLVIRPWGKKMVAHRVAAANVDSALLPPSSKSSENSRPQVFSLTALTVLFFVSTNLSIVILTVRHHTKRNARIESFRS